MTDYAKRIDQDAFRRDLINWFNNNKRTLPWREDQDPYKVWVSEIMLQQTQVDTVIPYFNAFIRQFPTPSALADADEQEVLKAWEGLGYYSRARNLKTAVKEVKESYGGVVPKEKQSLSKLKGIGPYTLGAIMSIAYNQPEPAVDGNVMRVLSRLCNIEEDIAKPKTKKTFEALVRQLISEQDPSSFNQGLMELGALICRPQSPKCDRCPVKAHCQAFHSNKQNVLPIKSKKKKQSTHSYYVLVLEDQSGQLLIEKRPENGLLANMWQFMMLEKKEVDQALILPYVEEVYQTQVFEHKQLESIKHVFSHVIWELDVHYFKVENIKHVEHSQMLVEKSKIDAFPFPVPHQKVYQYLN
ncbi:A/G-specific DNA-adenine glycosylase [Pelagirhabdus alkalitolerans]|uniref:Adenine DNA glycosylase n=1 Tax=Pelagirhabdus alkalitolerans TaxID=1612202 RepID=A0A1G6IG51_9BACI|nr:A/G-specific adenine glycosylase [Pelagirhabdus alkalitolerans]SDC04995.1 A/G-specific DNA-adenine glycosylase [Pelagirhabdus alkalitolerans]